MGYARSILDRTRFVHQIGKTKTGGIFNLWVGLLDFDNLEKLIRILPENSHILDTLGERFQSMGLCDAAA